MLCARCGTQIFKYVTCNSCNKKICFNCLKSSKRISKTKKAFICKDCWSNLKSRRLYKGITKEAF